MKFLFFILLCLFYYTPARSQQDVHFSQYMFNGLVYNPAYAGYKPTISGALLMKKQWTGFEDAPIFQIFSLHAPIRYEQMGLGLNIVNESFSFIKYQSLSFSYAYKINGLRGRLAFGMNGGIRQTQINLDRLTILDPDDPLLPVNNTTTFSPDLGCGVLYQRKKFFLGLSAMHLVPSRIFLNVNQQLHIYANMGYKISFSERFDMIPTTLVKYTSGGPIQADITCHLLYNNLIWAGASYRSKDAVSFQTGIHLNKLIRQWNQNIRLGYAYDMITSSLNPYTSGSHEIMLIGDFAIIKKTDKINTQKGGISPLFFEDHE